MKSSARRFLAVASLGALVAGVGSSAGCAFGNRNVNLVYEDVVSANDSYKGKVSLDDFDDDIEKDKHGRAVIGCVRNGYGMRTAKVLADNSPGEWLRDALAKELRNSGYQIADDSRVEIDGKLVNLFTDMFLAYDSKVSFRVTITDDRKEVYDNVFHGSGKATAWFATSDEYKNISNEALRDAMRKAIPEIKVQLERLKGKNETQ